MNKTQINDILHHLQTRLTITPREAVIEYDCYRLAAVVNELRKNHIIVTDMVKGKTKHGRPSQYARYFYVEEKKKVEENCETLLTIQT